MRKKLIVTEEQFQAIKKMLEQEEVSEIIIDPKAVKGKNIIDIYSNADPKRKKKEVDKARKDLQAEEDEVDEMTTTGASSGAYEMPLFNKPVKRKKYNEV
ncbi:MAG TPA: hypothetical protein VMZ91_15940 [Candidatus Paceibacterota bacterium]|nr:hypothetical protein [Candidatus Paceibacterota bacterium]